MHQAPRLGAGWVEVITGSMFSGKSEELIRRIRRAQIARQEGQFFDLSLVEVVNTLADRGVRVIVAGLDQDYMGRPFEPMPQLLAVAEYVDKTLAICMRCGAPANRSQRLVAATDRVLVGATGLYEARCRHCFDPNLATADKV